MITTPLVKILIGDLYILSCGFKSRYGLAIILNMKTDIHSPPNPDMNPQIDHVVMGCQTLDAGRADLESRLGVSIPDGGKHPLMSTHNALIQAGGDTYFELIATDPHVPPPDRKRLFSLDDPATQACFENRPRALCWVVSVRDLDALTAKSPIHLGEVLSLSRGDLSWRLTVPKDGHLPLDGLLPAFIEWPGGQNPCHRMPDKGVRLNQITISSPEPDQISDLMMSLGVSHLAHIVEGAKGLRFDMTTPHGAITLD